jgi:hypothetical protein
VTSTTFLEHFGRSPFFNPCPPDGPVPVARTGQTDSYGVPGSDGDLLRGVEWPVPRFTDNSDGTVTDNLTGLIWLKNASCLGERTWSQAIWDSHNLGVPDCDLTDGSSSGDWRLPNRFELESLLDMKYSVPSLSNSVGSGQWSEGDPFTNVLPFYYWSSTSSAYDSSGAWFVGMSYGYAIWDSKIYNYYVWPVRGGH